ncbi:LysR substrate-binding domain-containing protein [Salmonella enterica]|uniref:LysR substrate-binding domain-containing protein n=1 Tax=Salmonella enterica TaxID=28901 RepID=UPI003735E4BA
MTCLTSTLSLLSELDDVRRLFSRTQPPKGRLRLDVPITLARAVIIPALGDFQNRYPDIEIVLGTSSVACPVALK